MFFSILIHVVLYELWLVLIRFWLMQKLYVMSFTFHKSYYILLTTDHNYSVPADNYDSDKIFSQSIDPLGEAEDEISYFRKY